MCPGIVVLVGADRFKAPGLLLNRRIPPAVIEQDLSVDSVPGEDEMDQHVYKIVEIVGTSGSSIEDAIQTGITRAAQSLRNIGWFEVLETRGHVVDGRVDHFQVTMKLGFTLEGVASE